MANYSLVMNSKFRPFEYQELLAPALMATQAHQALEETYADLATKASIWDSILNRQRDSKSYEAYEQYARDLQEASDNLMSQGLTTSSRQALLNLRRRYAQEIAPIENAYKLRTEDIKRQQDTYDKSGGRTVFSKRAIDASIDDYRNGVPLDYSSVNLDSVAQAGMLGGKAISSRYTKTTEGKRFQGDYLNLITETGLSPEEAMEALQNSDKYPEFKKFVNDTLASYGYNNFDDINQSVIKDALFQGINMGIVYSKTENLQTNWRAQKELDFAHSEQHAQNAFKRQMELAQQKAAQDRAQAQDAMLAPVIYQGVEGQADPDLDRTKGLKKIIGSSGKIEATTDRLDKANKKLAAAKTALSNFENKYSPKQLQEIKSYTPITAGSIPKSKIGTSGLATMSANMQSSLNSTNAHYTEWKALKDKISKAEQEVNNEKSYLSNLAKKYSAYGDNMYDMIQSGIAAKKAHLGQQKMFYALNADNASYNNLKASIGRLTSANASIKNTSTGKSIDNTVLQDANTAIGVVVGQKNAFLALNDNEKKEYKIENEAHIDDFNRRLTYLNTKLGDFHSQRTTGNVITLSPDFKGNAGDMLQIAIKEGKAAHKTGTNMYAATARIPVQITNGRTQYEYINIVTDGYNIYTQTKSDEVYNQGKTREQIIKNIAAGALVDLIPMLAHTPEAKKEEK